MEVFPEVLCMHNPCTIKIDGSLNYTVPAQNVQSSHSIEFCLAETNHVELDLVAGHIDVSDQFLRMSDSMGVVWKACALQSNFSQSESLLLSPQTYLFEQYHR